MMQVREATAEDIAAIRTLYTTAFETEAEAKLVTALKTGEAPLISLVAEDASGHLLGHILFSPVTLEGKGQVAIAALAPMAVLPSRQRQGVGAALVQEGLEHCLQAGYDAVVVLGYPEYYSRFGFIPSVVYDIACEYDVPPEVFMAVELKNGALADCHGTVHYADAFDQL